MDIPTCYSSPDRRMNRPLFPDLPSAYAQIQGRRAVSLQPVSSSRSRTRFPLSPSSSSSDGELLVPPSLGNDGIRLKNLRCRKVRSAHVVLHEADHHPESSAIFETSDENTGSKRKKDRASTTLEEIVSQYADPNPSESALRHDKFELGRPSDHQRSVVELGQQGAAEADPFHIEPSRQSDFEPTCEHYQLYEQRAQRSGGAMEHEEAWEEGLESSRSGFFTPSKLRFRLCKRKTVDTCTSSMTGRTPASPWDPLSNSTQSKPRRPRPHLHYKGHPNHALDAHAPDPDQRGRRDSSAENKENETRQPRSAATVALIKDADGHRHRRCSNPARVSLGSPPHPSTLRPFNHITSSYDKSQSRPGHSSVLVTAHALASSSLLPKMLDNTCVPTSKSPSTMNSSTEEAPRAVASNSTFELSCLGTDILNDGDARTKRSDLAFYHDGSAAVHAGDRVEGPIRTVQSATTFKTLIPCLKTDCCASHRIILPYMTQDEALLAQHLYEGGYTLNDDDVSRFLRDSRRLRHGLETAQQFIDNHSMLGHRAYRSTGSSLANISSTSTTLNRLRVANASSSGSHYSDDDEQPARSRSQPARRVLQLWGGTGNTSEYTSLEDCRAVLVCNEAPISADERVVQRTAGTLLLAFGVVAYLPGGWMLIHSMGEGGPLATTAMAELTRVLMGAEEGVVCCVHPMDAAMARAIERAAVVLVVVGAFAWLAVAAWAATWW
ncbi:hypothetical protein CLCR_06740 [Cladophialophora carrionii]|uniref:Uncharacterized protein n=1 Tax=Cladophialophora carrionii TaxID=86049 RepID=A0A1C1CPA7_9EURO|nr:hypothetical protein CLCR_06740 [Cladophialophora carrionii]